MFFTNFPSYPNTSISFCFHHILLSFLWPMSNTATKLCFFWKNIVIMFGVSEKSRTFALAFRKYFRMSTKRKSSLKFLHTDKVVQELRVWSVFQERHAGYMTQSNDRGEYDNKRTFWQTKQTSCPCGRESTFWIFWKKYKDTFTMESLILAQDER